MIIVPKSRLAGLFLPLLLMVGIASESVAKQSLLSKDAQSSASEVTVTIAVPANKILTGTAIIVLEDISQQDAPSAELARVVVPASTLMSDQSTVAVPIDLGLLNPNATLNVAVHIDADDNGALSDGDWISDSLVAVNTHSRMAVRVDIIQIGA